MTENQSAANAIEKSVLRRVRLSEALAVISLVLTVGWYASATQSTLNELRQRDDHQDSSIETITTRLNDIAIILAGVKAKQDGK